MSKVKKIRRESGDKKRQKPKGQQNRGRGGRTAFGITAKGGVGNQEGEGDSCPGPNKTRRLRRRRQKTFFLVFCVSNGTPVPSPSRPSRKQRMRPRIFANPPSAMKKFPFFPLLFFCLSAEGKRQGWGQKSNKDTFKPTANLEKATFLAPAKKWVGK